ncbi:aldo/keto reductase [Paraburkholderia saeva]|uniref:Pyridoxal 4-dehydrogenase n=1 Tax=Paraburkholderia saeva TaxID=2777537 RepID=A0A9N8RST6_9BURK|nr:aldo/keto reductase [Paraburkholderia saeva]CAG4889970.1 Pyridoxal 4-dehydrogenase [Paraburkholderia saeva]CAG4922361.1 Pyridoxal 4-dehydrogenase [Paraburkholderia saeva]CAG4924625.1 Pyridoxal 4-dehydrogenase [Paraburkholderia saeva]
MDRAQPAGDVAAAVREPATPLQFSALGFGSAGIAGMYRDVTHVQALATVDAAWDAGVRYFDTAPFYGYTKGEHRLGAALSDRNRDEFVLSTKAGRMLTPAHAGGAAVLPGGWSNPFPFTVRFDYTRDAILRSFEDSLQRLGMARVDVLLVHDIGSYTHGHEPETAAHYWRQLSDSGFKALDELRSAGVVRAVGLGVNESAAIVDALREFDLDCALLAGRYTLLEQAVLTDLLPVCEARGVGVLIGGAFNSGILARGRGAPAHGPDGAQPAFNYGSAPREIVTRVERLVAVCDRFGIPLSAAALQFPYAHPAVKSIVTGARSPDEMIDNARGFALPIPPAFWGELKALGLIDQWAPVPGACAAAAHVRELAAERS